MVVRRRLALRPLPKDKFSKYRGISKGRNPNKPFIVQMTYLGKKMYFGAYATELEAVHAYDEASKKLFGEYAVLNEIIEDN